MKSFNKIYLLDLHGNSLKKEKCPDGRKDENVFDIRQGVAIALFIKKKQNKETNVLHADLWGLREDKYNWLLENDVNTTKWNELTPHSDFYLFVPRDEALLEQYEKYPKVTEIFPVNSVGIVTARDSLTIQDSPEKVWEIVRDFSTLPEDVARNKYNLGKDVRDWKVSFAQNDLRESGFKKELIVPILYRPFDIRHTYYTGHSRGFICMPRPKVMLHMMEENLGLITTRFVFRKEYGFHHAFVTKNIGDINQIQSPGTAQLFPLYLYPDRNKKKVINHAATKTPNFNSELVNSLTEAYNKEPTPEEIFYYIYAVLYSNIYRTKYAEFLKIDFPRVPFTKNYDLFKKMSEMGNRLADLHLLKSDELNNPIAKFQGGGENLVEKRKYDEGEERVYINTTQYFEGIEKEVWEYQIGGYQVLDKWLKDRKGRVLSLEDIKHYCRVVTVIRKTIEVQNAIDQIYPRIEEDVIEFSIQKAYTESLGDIP